MSVNLAQCPSINLVILFNFNARKAFFRHYTNCLQIGFTVPLSQAFIYLDLNRKHLYRPIIINQQSISVDYSLLLGIDNVHLIRTEFSLETGFWSHF